MIKYFFQFDKIFFLLDKIFLLFDKICLVAASDLCGDVDALLALDLDGDGDALLGGDVLADLLAVVAAAVVLQVHDPALHVLDGLGRHGQGQGDV